MIEEHITWKERILIGLLLLSPLILIYALKYFPWLTPISIMCFWVCFWVWVLFHGRSNENL